VHKSPQTQNLCLQIGLSPLFNKLLKADDGFDSDVQIDLHREYLKCFWGIDASGQSSPEPQCNLR
jgi:hypothetical protein